MGVLDRPTMTPEEDQEFAEAWQAMRATGRQVHTDIEGRSTDRPSARLARQRHREQMERSEAASQRRMDRAEAKRLRRARARGLQD